MVISVSGPPRRAGIVSDTEDLGVGAHVCWGFTRSDDFRSAAAAYLRDGLQAGLWIELVGPAAADLADDAMGLRGHGVGVSTVWDFYRFEPGTAVVDPLPSVSARIAAGTRVLDAGYTGYRAIVDATDVARTEDQRGAFARFELLIDRAMSDLPISAICGYDVGQLGESAVAEIHCLHPLTNATHPSFRLYALPGGGIALEGEVDSSCRAALDGAARALSRHVRTTELHLDASRLTFINQGGLAALEQFAESARCRVILDGAPPAIGRLLELLDLRRVSVARRRR